MLPLLPILAGVAVGAASVIAFNNRTSIKAKALEAKDSVIGTAKNVKDTVSATAECIGDKKEAKAKEVEGAK